MAVKKLMDINQESCLHLPNIIKELISMKIRRAEKACAFIGKVRTKFILSVSVPKKAVGPHTFSGAEVLHLGEIK